jgi:hypothetical protein
MNAYEYQQMNKTGVIGQVVTDTPLAIRIKYIGGGSVTSVTNTAATNLVLIATDSAGTSSTVTCTYAGASGNTVGACVDTINASPLWEAKVMDCLRTLATASSALGVDTGALSTSATDGVNYYDIHASTDVTAQFAYRLTYDRHVGAEKPKGAHRVTLKEVKYLINMNAAGADCFQIWETSPDGNTETKLAGWLSIKNTATTVNWASGEGYITAGYGHDLVIIVKDAATTLADSTANYLDVVGFRE